MSAIADVLIRAVLTGADGSLQINHDPGPIRFGPLVGQRQAVSLTGSSTFTSITVPSNASMVIIVLPLTAASLTLKGVTGDSGIPIVPASGYKGIPIVLPLGTSPTLGILNAGASVAADLIWL